MSEREPELGLGLVESVDRAARRIAIAFPASGEKRLYALGTTVLKRVQFGVGETLTTRDGAEFAVESIEDNHGLLTYAGGGKRVREDAISDVTSVSSPPERLMAAQVDPADVFDLRLRALEAQARFRRSEVRGFLGGRVELIPHQFYILHEVSRRQIPRVLLADEVGLGKTIEACLIVQRLLVVGKARRVLILVPESLVHQWFVELLRRFNLWFTIFDEERCVALEQSDPNENPFLSSQLGLANIAFLASDERRREQVVAAGWDMVVVDEAHHLAWSPEQPSPAYALVEQLGRRSLGLLLLTATPTQLGLSAHFARLRLLDPDRYSDYARFLEETEKFGTVAGIADKIIAEKRLTATDRAALKEIFTRDPARLEQLLEAVAGGGEKSAREDLLQTLLDQHGTGRVVFRNTRAAMSNFPKRKFCPAPGDAQNNLALLARTARELQAEETDAAGPEQVERAALRYSYKDDPRIDWLVALLKENRTAKILLIGKTQRKVAAIEAALQEKMKVKSALFHEGLPLVQRDRNAAWFAEPDGAQLLLCSEIGSEGRNFQFAHHLVLFDLPLNPALLEQRIGRLDRIGQTQTIRIHVPFLEGSADEVVVAWYHRGLDAFETSLQAGEEYEAAFKERLLALAVKHGDAAPPPRFARSESVATGRHRRGEGAAAPTPGIDAFIAETRAFHEELVARLKRGRDRLLELNSFKRDVAETVLARIRAAEADPFVRNFLLELLDHFGVAVKEHEGGDVFLDPSHAYIEGFPSIPADGMLATFTRAKAIVREDIRFLSADHALVQDAIDLLLDSKAGTTAFGSIVDDEPNLLLEAVYVLETVADSRWHVDQFLAPTPVRVVVDLRGRDVSDERDAKSLAADFEDGDVHRFLERPGFNAGVLKAMLDAAAEAAQTRSGVLKRDARSTAEQSLSADIERLVALQKVNDHIRPEEIALSREQLARTTTAIDHARLRLDSLRLVVAGPDGFDQ